MLFGEVPHFGVFCCSLIAKGVRFGPFQGKVVNASEVKAYGDNSLMWEVSLKVGRGSAPPWERGTLRAVICCSSCVAVPKAISVSED